VAERIDLQEGERLLRANCSVRADLHEADDLADWLWDNAGALLAAARREGELREALELAGCQDEHSCGLNRIATFEGDPCCVCAALASSIPPQEQERPE